MLIRTTQYNKNNDQQIFQKILLINKEVYVKAIINDIDFTQ